jgi:hypothetical protein
LLVLLAHTRQGPHRTRQRNRIPPPATTLPPGRAEPRISPASARPAPDADPARLVDRLRGRWGAAPPFRLVWHHAAVATRHLTPGDDRHAFTRSASLADLLEPITTMMAKLLASLVS